jgi:hypothetical protein
MRYRDPVVASLCIGLIEVRCGLFELRVAEVPAGHARGCDGAHGRVFGVLVEISGTCERCGQVGRVFTPDEPGYGIACEACVECQAMDAWLLMAAERWMYG